MNSLSAQITSAEQKLLEQIRNLGPYQTIEIKLIDNRLGKIVYTVTTKQREEFDA